MQGGPVTLEPSAGERPARPAWLARLYRPFVPPEGEAHERYGARAIAAVRIAFGLVCAHRVVDLAGFSLLAEDPSAFTARMAFELALALGIAAGLATPLCLGILVALCAGWPVMQYLGLQVMRMV